MTESRSRTSQVSVPKRLALFLLTAVGVVTCGTFVHVLLFPITGAVTLAIVLAVPFRKLSQRTGTTWAALITLATICLVAIVPGFFIARIVTSEAVSAVHYVQDGSADRKLQQLTAQHAKLGKGFHKLVAENSDLHLESRFASAGATGLGLALQGTVRGVTDVVLTLFLLFFTLRDRDEALRAISGLLPLPKSDKRKFLAELGDVVYAVFAGRFIIAGVQGTLAGIAYFFLGVPGSLLWGLATAVCCLIPAMGAFIAWVPIALYLGLAESWTKALMLAVWGGVVVSNIDNFLYPILVGKRTSLHPAVVFVSILGGLSLFGFSGLVLGPVVVAITMLLLRHWRLVKGTGSKTLRHPADVTTVQQTNA